MLRAIDVGGNYPRMSRPIPETGIGRQAVERLLTEARSNDKDKRVSGWNSHCFLYTFHASDEISDVAEGAYRQFLKTDPLGRSVFPSVVQLQQDLVGYTRHLLNGSNEAGGTVTTGGTESNILALLSAHNWARESRPKATRPNVVCPRATHASIFKAAGLLGLEVIRVPEASDFTTHIDAIEAAVNEQTIMLIGSAPTLWHGVIDPIRALAVLAEKYGLWLHVDACMGGFFAPFVRRAGYEVLDFDLSIPGVRSISADLHKYGYTLSGISTLLLRDAKDARYHRFDWSDLYCDYSTPGLIGTRSGGAIAAAWAVVNFVGERGFVDLARSVMNARDVIRAGVRSTEGLEVRGNPQLSILAFGSGEFDTAAIYSGLKNRGWSPNLFEGPRSIHLRLTPAHEAVAEAFVRDLRESVDDVRRGIQKATHQGGMYTA
jgi:sphinganine-1-phosphate aldolase